MIRTTLSLSTIPLIASYFWERFARQSVETALKESEKKRATLAKEVMRLEDKSDDLQRRIDSHVGDVMRQATDLVKEASGENDLVEQLDASRSRIYKLTERAEKAEAARNSLRRIIDDIDMPALWSATNHEPESIAGRKCTHVAADVIKRLQSELAETKAMHANALRMIDEWRGLFHDKCDAFDALTAQERVVRTAAEELQIELQKTQADLSVARAHAASLERDLAKAREDVDAMDDSRIELSTDMQKLEERFAGERVLAQARLEKALSTLEQYPTGTSAVTTGPTRRMP